MKLCAFQAGKSSVLLAIGLFYQLSTSTVQNLSLIDKCCRVGKERAVESSKFNCKMSAREALVAGQAGQSWQQQRSSSLLAHSAETLLARDPNFADQCEMVLESCCMAHHRTRNCDSGKQFAKSGAACMDVELSKEATIATESFNDCCMSCSLGILAARTPSQNETSAGRAARCKLMSPLASSLSGQLYEQTYVECCQENLPRYSSALLDPSAPIDCTQSNPCAQRCVTSVGFGSASSRHRCDCFAGYKLAPDQVNCVDVDECKLGQHSCNKQSEVCDNTRGGFRCLARQSFNQPAGPAKLQSSADDLDQSADFSSMRLCPLGSRWSPEESRCRALETAFNQRSASLFSASLSSVSNNQEQFIKEREV